MVGDKHPGWKGGKTQKQCVECGKTIYVSISPSTIKRNAGRFCSKKCQGKWRSKNIYGKNSPSWNRVERKCLKCGKSFYVTQSIAKIGNGKFCSNLCYFSYRVGENASNWKGGKIKRNCLTCGNVFYVDPNVVKRNNGKFCSRSCQSIWTMQHCKTKNTSIEIMVEKMLKKIKIKYLKQSSIPECCTIPDFYIKEKRVAIYVDGVFWHKSEWAKKHGKTKTDNTQNFLLEFNGYKVLRLDEEEVRNNPKLCLQKIKKSIFNNNGG